MKPQSDLDRLLVTLDVDVQTLAFCELRRSHRLVAPPINALMVHYVLAGTMHMDIPGCEPVVCPPGSIALIPPAVPLHVAADKEPDCDVIATEHCVIGHDGVLVCDATGGGAGDLRYVSGIVLASFSGSFGLFDRIKTPITHNLGDTAIVRQAYELMLAELTEPHVGSRALTSALMKVCLVLLIRQFISRRGPRGILMEALPDPRFSKAITAVLDRPSGCHTLDSLASAAGMSRSRFATQFKDAFDMSPMMFVAKARLHHAAQLLRSTPLPVKVIAGTAGFASRSHFSRAFKASYGTDPSAFREKHGVGALDPPPVDEAPASRLNGVV
ncbi:MAG: AraC family transcriptional regulator [Pseudomonadota bacterium]|nr:AraC family transcriptional regulator [Pseudomonadota bacterium]